MQFSDKCISLYGSSLSLTEYGFFHQRKILSITFFCVTYSRTQYPYELGTFTGLNLCYSHFFGCFHFFDVPYTLFLQPSFRLFLSSAVYFERTNACDEWNNKRKNIAWILFVVVVVDKIMMIMESIAILVDETLWYWPLIGAFFHR